jgi:hypothetical protein
VSNTLAYNGTKLITIVEIVIAQTQAQIFKDRHWMKAGQTLEWEKNKMKQKKYIKI